MPTASEMPHRHGRHRPLRESAVRPSRAQTLLLIVALLASTATAASPGTNASTALTIHRRRVCVMDTLARTAFADVTSAETFFDHSSSSPSSDAIKWTRVDTCGADVIADCVSGQNVATTDGKLTLSASAVAGGARVAATIPHRVRFNATTRLRVHASFPSNESADHSTATIALSLPRPHGGMSVVSMSVMVSSTPRLRLASPASNWSIDLVPPCPLTSSTKIHVVDVEWTPTRWLRWHWDGHLLYEMRLPKALAFTLKKHNSTTTHSPLRIDLSLTSTTTTTASAGFRIKTLELQRVADDQDDAVCRPRVRSPEANCRRHTHFEPRLGADQGYLSLAQIYDFMRTATTRFPPHFTKLEELGVSTQNRSLLALCVGACARMDVPQVLFTGMHHSREPVSMMNLVYTIDLLALDLVNGVADTTSLLRARQLWFILVVNPDGYARNEAAQTWAEHQSGQRKNGRAGCNRNPRDSGVDLNRNYDVCFAQDNEGSSTDPCGEDFRGPAPFSEPETLAIKRFVEQPTAHFSVALNYHSFGRFFNVPFACKVLDAPRGTNLTVYENWAMEMTRFNGFAYGQPWKDDNLYSVNGETSDWLWAAHGIFAMSPEVGPAFSTRVDKGFWPARDEIPALAVELHYSNIVAARMAGPIYDVVVTNVTRQPALEEDEKSLRELLVVEVALQNKGLRTAGDVELLLTTSLVNSTSSTTFTTSTTIPPTTLGTIRDDGPRKPIKRVLAIPVSSVVHLIVRDGLSCQYIRLTTQKKTRTQATFQQWDALELPLCGFCRSVGRDAAALAALEDDAENAKFCETLDDLVDAKSLSRARLTILKVPSNSPAVDPTVETREAAPTIAPVVEPTATSTPVPAPAPSRTEAYQPATQETTATTPPETTPSSVPTRPTSQPSPTTTTPVKKDLSASTNSSAEVSSSLLSFASVPILATLFLVAVIAFAVVVRHRRRATEKRSKKPASTAAAKPTRRKNYVKVVNDEDEAEELQDSREDPKADRDSDDGDADDDAAARRTTRRDDSDDDSDAEFGRRRNPFAVRPRGPSDDEDLV